ncbi:putative glycosyltransferase [Camellia lanceoleosa]|uniref:Glycosyltransferase n=1 Tax=Camellia lanceoleosa TaxID=1840588 RepID=A0ACC0FTD7_9ERIC|nr:putative glycosyltransferase [Camellia lanceoleosa]
MAASRFSLNFPSRRPLSDSFRHFLVIPTILAFLTTIFIFHYISSTSTLVIHLHDNHHRLHVNPQVVATKPLRPIPSKPIIQISLPKRTRSSVIEIHIPNHSIQLGNGSEGTTLNSSIIGSIEPKSPPQPESPPSPVPSNPTTTTTTDDDDDVFHNRETFFENYNQMNKTFKIFVYPTPKSHPFANVLLPVSSDPGGNYASESFFKKSLAKSHFLTTNPSDADFFFLPFSIAAMRHDRRIGVGGLQNFVRDYVVNVSKEYPYWNRSGGADHFYVACHSIGKIAMDKAVEVRVNAVQVVCSSNYFVSGYVAHKDVSLPQIWPRQGDPPKVEPSKRKRLAFFAGAINSPARIQLVEVWKNDSEIFAHRGRLTTPYSTELLQSKYCLHAKGYEVNTARIGDALYYGCVPVILADYYDLPFADILNWKSFSVVVATVDIPLLKNILNEVGFDEYLRLQKNVLKVRRHFQWHGVPAEYDAFHMVLYELWLRRSFVRFS